MTGSTPLAAERFDGVRSFIDSHQMQFQDRLFDFLRIPSVSSDSTKADAMTDCAKLVRELMIEAGLDTEILPTDGHPIVYGERLPENAGPCLLVYGHYDVQPPEPLDAWDGDPFEPRVVNGSVIARGSSDDKGQIFSLLCGIHAATQSGLGEKVGLKVLVEGEEEVGSPSLVPFIRKEQERLRASAVLISDSSQLGADLPAITYGLRGLTYLEIVVRGPAADLHSGTCGGAVANPANVLTRLLRSLQEPFGKISIPGFYDHVVSLDSQEREALRALPFDEENFRRETGSPKLWGEDGFTTLERRWARPTLDINGLVSGHTGEGAKTVIPREARAKVSMRLVPDQDPDDIFEKTRDYLLSLAPDTVEVEILSHHGAKPVVVRRDLDAMRAAEAAVELGFGKRPYFIREGGSIPVVNTFKEELGLDTVMIGLGLPDDRIHGPNEKFSLADFRRGMLTMAGLMEAMGSE